MNTKFSKLAALVAVCAALTVSATAGPGGGKGGKHGAAGETSGTKGMAKMQERGPAARPLKKLEEAQKLNLTADQKTKIDALAAESRTKMRTLLDAHKSDLEASKGDPQKRREIMKAVAPEMKTIASDVDTQLSAILTPEQQQELTTKVAAAAAAGKGDRKRGKDNDSETTGAKVESHTKLPVHAADSATTGTVNPFK